MQPEIVLASDARQVLENKAYKLAYDRLSQHLDSKILACNPDDKEQAHRVVLAKQIFSGLKRELERMIQDGQVSEIQLNEIEKRKKSVFRR